MEGSGVGEMDGEMTEEELGELLGAVLGRADPEQGLYLALDGITVAHLDAFRVLFPHAAGFSLFPWLNQVCNPPVFSRWFPPCSRYLPSGASPTLRASFPNTNPRLPRSAFMSTRSLCPKSLEHRE